MRRTLGGRTPTAEIRAALAKATPGPWEVQTCEEGGCCMWLSRVGDSEHDDLLRYSKPPTLELIAAAPAWLAELCDRLEAAEAKLAAVRAELSDHATLTPGSRCDCPQHRILRALDGEQP